MHVRGLVAQRARHEALAGFWTAKAAELGLESEAGLLATEQATKHGQRAERLAVTALDMAVKFAQLTKPSAVSALDRIAAAARVRIAPPAEPLEEPVAEQEGAADVHAR